MNTTSRECEMLSVKDLLSNDDRYLIPMYQRNYAWEEPHLSQLIQDVWDCHKNEQDYYIGTLVVHHRPDGKYETVDGQQRLTTLNILLCAVKNELELEGVDVSWYKFVNIEYEYRERSTVTLRALYDHNNDYDLKDVAISNMYRNVRRSIERIIPETDRGDFFKYLFEKVIVTRVVLPADTDLNHYFEIMNSRGEQLEKHEILKAQIMGLSSSGNHWLIGQIWEACADMDRYVPLNFTPQIRNIIFGREWDKFKLSSLGELVEATKDEQKQIEQNGFSIDDIYNETKNVSIKEEVKDGDRFESVIKFPGFLLQVLRVMTGEDIPLDDKRLLSTFKNYLNGKEFADKFILRMLELRFLFDKFVIRRDYKDDIVNGKMNLLTLTRQYQSFSYNNTYGDPKENKRVIMVESMFHVSLPSQNYKHWLSAVLKYVDKHNDGQGLGCYLEELAKIYMFGRFLSKDPSGDNFYYNAIFGNVELTKPKSIEFPKYTEHIDFFIFNYIDYCIWKKENDFKDFEFTSRSSVEHFYPQHPLSGSIMDDAYLHSIGNLCLISASKNSELSNYSPSAKTEHYSKTGYDSLKQALMMKIVNKNKAKSSESKNIWWEKEVKTHREYIQTLVLESFGILGKKY